MSELILYGATWCNDCKRSKDLLDELNVKYNFINIDKDEEATKKVVEFNNGLRVIPTIVLPDGKVLTEPSNKELLLAIRELG